MNRYFIAVFLYLIHSEKAHNPNTRAEATVTLNGKQAEMVLDSLRDKAKQVKAEIKKAESRRHQKSK